MRGLTLVLLLAGAAYTSAFHETFSEGWDSRWVHSGKLRFPRIALFCTNDIPVPFDIQIL